MADSTDQVSAIGCNLAAMVSEGRENRTNTSADQQDNRGPHRNSGGRQLVTDQKENYRRFLSPIGFRFFSPCLF